MITKCCYLFVLEHIYVTLLRKFMATRGIAEMIHVSREPLDNESCQSPDGRAAAGTNVEYRIALPNIERACHGQCVTVPLPRDN